MRKITFSDISTLIVSIFICQFAGIIGSFSIKPAMQGWYQTLNKPFFTPPNWLFAPVWVILFFLMGIALFLILKKGPKSGRYKKALYVFSLQFCLNILWSFLFFALKSPGLAFLEIILLLAAILHTILIFYKIKPKAGLILLPYFFWVIYAAALNYAVWIMN
jgi:translocator protein